MAVTGKPVMPASTFLGMASRITNMNQPDRSHWTSINAGSGWGPPAFQLSTVRIVPWGNSQTHIVNATDVDSHGWWEPQGFVGSVVAAGRP